MYGQKAMTGQWGGNLMLSRASLPFSPPYEAPNVMQPILKWGFHVSTRLLHDFGHERWKCMCSLVVQGKAYLEE